MLDSSAAKSSRRKSSRSNSTSSSSIVTVQRATSLSSRTGPKVPYANGRPQSPDQTSTYLSPPKTLGNADRGRSSSHGPVGNTNGVREGVGNLNRWSQSTASSRPSTPGQSIAPKTDSAQKRRRSFSQRLSFSGSSFTSGNNTAAQLSPPARNVLTKPRPSPTKSANPGRSAVLAESSSAGSEVLEISSKGNIPASSPPTLVTPSTRSIDSGDYFSDTWQANSPASSKNTTLGPDISASANQSPRDVLSSKVMPHSRSISKSPLNPASSSQDDLNSISGGHSRYRESNKGSGGTDGGSSASSVRSDPRKHRPASQKTMLSKALQKANTAVLLDNAQNFERAMVAYEDACQLLQQVMLKSTGDEDKRKLQSIRTTYLNRIRELRGLDSSYQVSEGKALPDRPTSNATTSTQDRSSNGYDDPEDVILGTATATRIVNNSDDFSPYQNVRSQPFQPLRQQPLLPSAVLESLPLDDDRQSRNFSRSPLRKADQSVTPRALAPPFQTEYIPAPLSPRRGTSPNKPDQDPTSSTMDDSQQHQDRPDTMMSTETTSWLDTIDESGGSSRSSVHSRSSSMRMRRRQLRAEHGVDDTEVEFEAALDAAVEAAYDDGFEIADEMTSSQTVDDVILQNRRNIELAKLRVQEAQMEASLLEEAQRSPFRFASGNGSSSKLEDADDEAEEEERILEEMTRGYAMDEFEFGLQSKSALPRQSDSSSFSGRTWPSSLGSNTANTSLSPSMDSVQMSSKQKLPPLRPPPMSTLPPAPAVIAEETSAQTAAGGPPPRPPSFTVRERRLSSQNMRHLTIDTNAPRSKSSSNAPTGPAPPVPVASKQEIKTATIVPQIQYPSSASAIRRAAQAPSPLPEETVSSAIERRYEASEEGLSAVSGSPQRLLTKSITVPESIRKNKSATSLKARNLSASAPEQADISPITPNSSTFPITIDGRKGLAATIPVIPTPTGNNFTVNGLPTGGMYLLDDGIQAPASPGSRNGASSAPLPLEPCPESFLLRPFWLMRCLYQTIAHPRGGYLSTKLFVPRDVWRVKNVKIKGIEEKIASCDLLTAALQKLSKVDTYDADAVLEDMQAFETVLEQVRVSLAKKLGNEVGVQHSAALFKGAASDETNVINADASGNKTPNAPGKSYLSSWRKLRNKSSGPALTTMSSASSSSMPKDSTKDTLTLPSLPMTSSISSRPSSSRRTAVSQVQPTGPNANYMGALARLFDSVQILGKSKFAALKSRVSLTEL